MSVDPLHRILIVEDDEALGRLLERALTEEGFQTCVAARGEEALDLAQEADFDVVVCDLFLLGMDGFSVMRDLHQSKPHLPIILMTGHGSVDVAIKATKMGAIDYITKPFEPQALSQIIRAAIAQSSSSEEPMPVDASGGQQAHQILGKSRAIQSVCKQIGRLAPGRISVLIRGETGTGKELVARALHQYSDREAHHFVAVNCMAIPETLLESELFGYERGAFTGAVSRRIGRFEQAHQGTLFLDEIGDMSLSTQGKLLRVLQERTIQRLGSQTEIAVDVRIVAATNRDLEKAVREGAFRENLYYRLNGAVIALPALRERTEDIPSLAGHFLQRSRNETGAITPTISVGAMELLQKHSWPGNIRELESVICRAVLLSQGQMVTSETIQQSLAQASAPSSGEAEDLRACVTQLLERAQRENMPAIYNTLVSLFERELLSQALHRAQGNQSKMAQGLGISRSTIHEKMRAFGLK